MRAIGMRDGTRRFFVSRIYIHTYIQGAEVGLFPIGSARCYLAHAGHTFLPSTAGPAGCRTRRRGAAQRLHFRAFFAESLYRAESNFPGAIYYRAPSNGLLALKYTNGLCGCLDLGVVKILHETYISRGRQPEESESLHAQAKFIFN